MFTTRTAPFVRVTGCRPRRGAAPAHLSFVAGAIAAGTIAAGAMTSMASCADVRFRALSDVPGRADQVRAVAVVHDQDCDAGLSRLSVFERDDVRGRLPLVGIVALDERADTAHVRRSLAAYDVATPLLDVHRATRDSLRAAARDRGMTVLLVQHGRVVFVLPPPTTLDESMRYARNVYALAAGLPTP